MAGSLSTSKSKEAISTEEIYCICRSSNCSRFMIGCEKCNEWYHGDCINVTAEEAQNIKHWFCNFCREKNPSLKIIFHKKLKKVDSDTKIYTAKELKESHSSTRIKSEKPITEEIEVKKKGTKYDNEENDNDYKPSSKKQTIYEDKKTAHDYKIPLKSNTTTKHTSKTKTKEKEDNFGLMNGTTFWDLNCGKLEGPRQCFGPGCVEAARHGSKYCSDDCGLKLATNRIFEILPQRIREWQASPSVAEMNNRAALDKIRKQQLAAKEKLLMLDERQKQLSSIIERAKKETVLPVEENEGDEDSDLIVFCVTCGHELAQKMALKHMEKCYNKFESQTSFGSIYKTRIEGEPIFCDTFNPTQKTYCKRLKVLCPEHNKEPRISDDEVCGCPLVTDVFEYRGEFCRAPRRKCSKHHCWEKLRKAEIAMERLRQWMCLDELFEQERQIRIAMANRAGVLGLMLHHTIDHNSSISLLPEQ